MEPDRCPACGAAVTERAQWCTLCYASLSAPTPEPQPEPQPQPQLAHVAATPVSVGAAALPPHPILDAPVLTIADAQPLSPPGWPCHGCGATVPLTDDTCSTCGSGFLPTDPRPSLNLPVVGDVGRLDKTQRVMLMVGGVFGVTLLLVLLAFVGGSIL